MSLHPVESLLAPYAVHAVEPVEVRSVEEHLASCPRCRDEVAEYQSTAALLGNSVGEAPDGLWDRIAAELGDSGRHQPAPEVHLPTSPVAPASVTAVPSSPEPVRRRRRTVALLSAAAAVVVVLLLAFQVVRLNDRVSTLRETVAQRGVEQDASEAVLGPHSTVSLRSDDNTFNAKVVVQPDGTAYLVEHSLPELGPDRAYQLWSLGPAGPVSLAVLGPDPAVSAFWVGSASRLVVTNEPAGGSPGPTSVPLVGGELA